MDYTFASIMDPTRRYVLAEDSMAYFNAAYHTAGALSTDLSYYSTLGDGNTQHTPNTPVTIHELTDFCYSIAASITSNLDFVPNDHRDRYRHRVIRFARYEMAPTFNEAAVRFALSVKYVEDKPSYFNLSECKVSRSPNKRFDKRWHAVTSDMDGSYVGAFRILTCEKDHVWWLERLCIMYQLLLALASEDNRPWGGFARMSGIWKDEDDGQEHIRNAQIDLNSAWECAWEALRAVSALSHCSYQASRYAERCHPKQEDSAA